MGNVHNHINTSTTAHRTRRSQIPLAREDESTNSGNMDEPFRVVDNALDGVFNDAVPSISADDFPNDDAFVNSGLCAGEGED